MCIKIRIIIRIFLLTAVYYPNTQSITRSMIFWVICMLLDRLVYSIIPLFHSSTIPIIIPVIIPYFTFQW